MNRLRMLLVPILFLSSISLVAQDATVGQKETGLAAVYTHRLDGHRTASGRQYKPGALTAAHKTLPFGSVVKVTNVHNHRSVTVRINDRGPSQAGRILDLSPAAGHRIGIPGNSMRQVELEVVSVGSGGHAHAK